MIEEPASALIPSSNAPRLSPRPQYLSQIPANILISRTPVASYADASPMGKGKPDAVGVHNLQTDNMSFSTAPSTTGQTLNGTMYLKQFDKANQQAAQVLMQTLGKSEAGNQVTKNTAFPHKSTERKTKAAWRGPSSRPFGRAQPDAYLSPSKPRAISRPKGPEESMLIVGKGQFQNSNSNFENNLQGYPNLRPVKPVIGQHLPLAVPLAEQQSAQLPPVGGHLQQSYQQPSNLQASGVHMNRRNSVVPRGPQSIFQNTALANLDLDASSGGASPQKVRHMAHAAGNDEDNMFKINGIPRHRNSASVTLDPLRSSRRTLELLPAEHTDFIAKYREQNRQSSSQVQSNFDPGLYQNQQVLPEQEDGMQNITSYLMKTGDRDTQNHLLQAASYLDQRRKEFGKTPLAGLATGIEGGPERISARRRSSRNQFLGSVYNNILSSVQSQVQDSTIPVGDQIPLSLREEALYPKINTMNSQLSNYDSPDLKSRNQVPNPGFATLDLGPNDAQKQALSDRFSSQYPLNSRRTTIEMQMGSQQLARLQTHAVNETQATPSPYGSPTSVFGKQKTLDITTGGMNVAATAVDSGDISPLSFSQAIQQQHQPAPMANNWGYPSQPISHSGFSSPIGGSPIRSEFGVPQSGLYPTQAGLHYDYSQQQPNQAEQPVPMVQAPSSGRFDLQRVSPLKYGMPMSPL